MENAVARAIDSSTPDTILAKKFPHLRGGNTIFRNKPAKEKLQFLAIVEKSANKRLISFSPLAVARNEIFSITITNKANKSIALVKIHLLLPSGKSQLLEHAPQKNVDPSKQLVLDNF